MLPLPAGFGPASNGKTFAPTRIFPALPSPSPNLLAHIPLEVSGDAKQVATPALSSPPPAPPASSWVLYNSAQADSKRVRHPLHRLGRVLVLTIARAEEGGADTIYGGAKDDLEPLFYSAQPHEELQAP